MCFCFTHIRVSRGDSRIMSLSEISWQETGWNLSGLTLIDNSSLLEKLVYEDGILEGPSNLRNSLSSVSQCKKREKQMLTYHSAACTNCTLVLNGWEFPRVCPSVPRLIPRLEDRCEESRNAASSYFVTNFVIYWESLNVLLSSIMSKAYVDAIVASFTWQHTLFISLYDFLELTNQS